MYGNTLEKLRSISLFSFSKSKVQITVVVALSLEPVHEIPHEISLLLYHLTSDVPERMHFDLLLVIIRGEWVSDTSVKASTDGEKRVG